MFGWFFCPAHHVVLHHFSYDRVEGAVRFCQRWRWHRGLHVDAAGEEFWPKFIREPGV